MEEKINQTCWEDTGYRLMHMTEIDPLWNDDYTAALLTPEATLFTDKDIQLSCITDSISSNVWLSSPDLFWCMGSWGSAYPMTGHNNDEDYVQANNGIAARMLYKMARENMLLDPGVTLCYAVPTPIWIKWHYRMQVAQPMRHHTCYQIGTTGIGWAYSQNMAFSKESDNVTFILFRKGLAVRPRTKFGLSSQASTCNSRKLILKQNLKQTIWIATLIIFLCLLTNIDSAKAKCEGELINPMDVCWQCIFPIKIGGQKMGSASQPDNPDCPAKEVLCACQYGEYERYGVTFAMWEPARLIETVKDPWCFPSLDMDLGDSSGGGSSSSDAELRGGTESMGNQEVTRTFAQAHYWGFYAYQMMEEDINKSCWEDTGYKLLYMTEIDPLWNDDYTAALIMPEATLFTDKDIQLSCMVDSISSNLWLSSPILFWCMGSWGSAYPMTGHNNDEDYVQANNGIAARMLYKMARENMLLDPGVLLCYAVSTPIWIKWHYRMQIAQPTSHWTCYQIGASGILWAYEKNPAFSDGGDNFTFILFRKRSCCASN
ncbi:MAG: TraU family protein [Deltaproteobacteria bacterium]|nr:TraU family protein [Deltaproteobacteria bacterium]